MIDLGKLKFDDHPENPVIEPPNNGILIADPTVLTPDLSPDNQWHLYAHSLKGIHHYTSKDGIKWARLEGPLFMGLRPYLYVENGYHLFYERFHRPWRTVISVRSSTDLKNWSSPRDLISPQFGWEKRGIRNNGNPCVVKCDIGYRLYFAANWVRLKDTHIIIEPKYIGYAQAQLLLGPYKKHPDPIISPTPDVKWRNYGAGSIKVIPPSGDLPWFGLNNGIYIDEKGASRSEIRLLKSHDGLDWEEVHDYPLIAPQPGWKEALVYAMHFCAYKNKAYIYFNARDGWFKGIERIGVAIAVL